MLLPQEIIHSLEQNSAIVLGAVIAQSVSARLRAGRSGVRVPAGAGDFSLHHRVQNSSGAHPASHTMRTGSSFPRSKAAGP
jgi:hypothetical protein